MKAYNKIYYHGLLASILTAGTMMVCGCSNDTPYPDGDQQGVADGTPVEVAFSLSALRAPQATKADGTPEDPASNYEKINSWWIAFVDHNGKTVKVLKRSDAETQIASNAAPTEMEHFKCIIPAGTYTIYAFANISPEQLTEAAGVTFTPGATLPSGISGVDNAVWSSSLNGWSQGEYLPMSGFLKNVRIRNTVEENFAIQVVRMAAKMELQFTNTFPATDGEAGDVRDVTVTSITVDPVTTSSISLFPKGTDGISYSHLGVSAFSPLANPTYASTTFSLPSGGLTVGKVMTPATIYLQESLSDRENDKAFTIGVNVLRADGKSQYEQYNITRDILAYINRNDHIRIPVTLSRYYVDVDAVFYPPIGGYPAAASSTDPEGSQIFTFSSQGDFAIMAHVTDKLNERHLEPARYSVTLGTISDPNSIFGTAPSVETASPALPPEVTGTLNAKKGKATVELTVKVFDRPQTQTGATVTDTYTRKIYIIRD